jgi:hypothetical protein
MRMSGRSMAESLLAIAIALPASIATAEPIRWTRYSIPETGTSVQIPASVFSTSTGNADGLGSRFQTPDGRADLTVQSLSNTRGVSPAAFLAKKHPPSDIVYRRVTPQFFVVSSFKGDKIWYDRCNFADRFIHCVLINYPAAEKRQWDEIVTRISNTLTADE